MKSFSTIKHHHINVRFHHCYSSYAPVMFCYSFEKFIKGLLCARQYAEMLKKYDLIHALEVSFNLEKHIPS